MPWWGWLIVAGMSLIAMYYLIVFVFFAKFFGKVSGHIDHVHKQVDRDPFDDPFFKRNHFDDPFFK